MKILVFGATSLVGVALAERGDVTVVHCRAPSDRGRWMGKLSVQVENATEMKTLIEAEAPDAILYCHAVCDVGRCEEEPAWAHEVNVGGVAHALAAAGSVARFVYVSSDHIFGGDGVYSESSAPRPISAYARTRVLAEQLVCARADALVVRPGLAVGPSLDGRTGHMDWLRHRAARGLPISIVTDEARSAVWAGELAERLVALTRSDVRGVRNLPASRMVSRPELARHLMRLQRIEPTFHMMTRAERPFPHLGRVELRSDFDDAFAAPLRSVLD
jgi:dTDP-4-dehydrorhamnose reductase